MHEVDPNPLGEINPSEDVRVLLVRLVVKFVLVDLTEDAALGLKAGTGVVVLEEEEQALLLQPVDRGVLDGERQGAGLLRSVT